MSNSPTATKSASAVVFLAGKLLQGGSEKQLSYLIENLDRTKFRPIIVTFELDRDGWWQNHAGQHNYDLVVLSSRRRWQRIVEVVKRVLSLKPRIILTVHFFMAPYAWIAAKLTGAKLVSWIRFLPNERGLQKHQLGRLNWFGLKGADLLICNAKESKRLLARQRDDEESIVYIANGSPIPSDSDIVRNRSKYRTHFQLEDDCQVIGFIGRLDPNKNVSLLLKAMTDLPNHIPGSKLLIIGDGPSRNMLEREADELGIMENVHFAGAIPQAAQLIPAFDILCLTSKTEGMPNVVAEGLANGVPCIATATGGSVELISDGENGFLTENDSSRQLVDALVVLLNDRQLRQKFGKAGRRRIAEEFTVDRMVSQHELAFSKLLNSGSNPQSL